MRNRHIATSLPTQHKAGKRAWFEPTIPVFHLSWPLRDRHQGRYKCISSSPLFWHHLTS